VKIVTERGEIIVELFENEAENTVANFISLADKQFYDTTTFHQDRGNDRITGGDPNTKPGATGTPGQGDAGYLLPDEHERPDHRNHFAGSIGMTKTNSPNSGSCQFYITVAPNASLNGRNTVFGRVIDGLDVVREIKQDDVIESVTVIRRKSATSTPTTLPMPGSNAATTDPLRIGVPGSSSGDVAVDQPSDDSKDDSEVDPLDNPLINPPVDPPGVAPSDDPVPSVDDESDSPITPTAPETPVAPPQG
jgi:peptidyl-prolyl cis-trans isomerase B (cyclophilin B)